MTKADRANWDSISNSILGNKPSQGLGTEDSAYIEGIKKAYAEQSTRIDKLKVLTTLPPSWSIAKMRKEIGVSRRTARLVKALRENEGHGSGPEKKKGRKLAECIVIAVKEFYMSDFASRILPGMKDCLTIKLNNKQKIKIQKRLLLSNLKDLHAEFRKKCPDSKLSVSKFTTLRPLECIPVGQSGSHNVCVCRTHQNIRLKLRGIHLQLRIKGFEFSETYHDFIEQSLCEEPTSACYMLTCKSCPGGDPVVQKLRNLFEVYNVTKVRFSQWLSTDR